MLIKNIIKILFATFIILLPVLSFSQVEQEMDEEEQIEAKQQVKVITPLIKLWYLDGFGAFKDSTRLDTIQDYFHIYNPVYKDAISVSYLGNYGTPYQNNNFFQRESTFDFFFLNSREAYLLNPGKVKYYNTRTPYTKLDFSQSQQRTKQNETRFNVLHTQNINPYLNVTFRYDQAKSEGQYKHQQSKNNFVTLYSNYNRDKLSIHGGFISNSIKNNENGGLTRDELIVSNTETEFLDVKLNNTRSEFGNMYFYGTGEYRIGKTIKTTASEEVEEKNESSVFKPIVGIIYSFEYQSNLKEFIDEEDSTNTFFQKDYYGEEYIKDSIRFRKIQNIIQLKKYENADRNTSFGTRAFLGQEFVKASMPGPDTGYFNRQTKRYSNIYAGGGIFRLTGDFWTWNFDGKIYLLGRNAGQTELSGIISKPFTLLKDSLTALTIEGKIENRVPDYFQDEFYSQHIRWNNNFKMEQRMTVNGRFNSPLRKLEFGANYSIINNFIYNDTAGIPSQTSKELLVISAYLDKDFNFGDFHFRTRLLWQKASDQSLVHLPDFSAFVSTYYQFVISKVLFTQLGIDTRYNTSYYADAYDPATGLFYLQNEQIMGDFPYIDAYASLRLKRTRVFFKMMNIGTEFIDREYFTVPHYPMNRRTFRFGVSWVFYD